MFYLYEILIVLYPMSSDDGNSLRSAAVWELLLWITLCTCFVDKGTRPGEHLFGKLLGWFLSGSLQIIIFSTSQGHKHSHTHLLLLVKMGLSNSPSLLSYSNHLTSLFHRFSLIQSLCVCCQHNACYFHILFLLPQLHKHTHTISHTPNALPRVL